MNTNFNDYFNNINIGNLIQITNIKNYISELLPPSGEIFIVSELEYINLGISEQIKIKYYSLERKLFDFLTLALDETKELNRNLYFKCYYFELSIL